MKDRSVTPTNLKVGLAVALKPECQKGPHKYFFKVISIEGDKIQLKGFASDSNKTPVDKIWHRTIQKAFIFKCYEIVDAELTELIYG